MPDLTTYAPMPRTIPTADLTAFNQRRAVERQAREDKKRARLARFREIDRAAAESTRKSTRAPLSATEPRPARERKGPIGRPPSRDILVVCKGGCGRMTHPKDHKTELYPNAVRRLRDGKCSVCITGGRREKQPPLIKPCTVCGHQTRNQKIPQKDAPETRVRVMGGRCVDCAAAGAVKPAAPPKVNTGHYVTTTSHVNWDQVVTDYQAGMPLAAIGTKHRIAPNTARRHLDAVGVERRPAADKLRGRVKPHNPELVEAVRHHYHVRGLNQVDTGRAVGLHPETVSRILHRYGIPVRPSARQKRTP